jgi:hypothetical protein
MRRALQGLGLVAVALACRGERPGSAPGLQSAIDSLIPQVERAVGITFQRPPRFAIRSREQVSRYLLTKLEQEFPPAKVEGVEAAYNLLGLLADTVRIRSLLLGLYAEQVAGYYDPDSLTLYAVEGAEGAQLRLVLAHELVHALQHEQLPLERLLKDLSSADRLAASQAVLEGHATIAMLGVMVPDRASLLDPQFWRLYREQVKAAQTSMPVFRSAPLVLQEGLIFPYLAGAEFMRWWEGLGRGRPLPLPDELPQSSEQILHPDRYLAGDGPVTVRFADSAAGVMHEDTMGELELAIWTAELRGGGEVLTGLPLGWGGDRFRVYRTPDGPALVLHTVWDDSVSARRFATGPARRFAERPRAGYRTGVDTLTVAGRPAVRVVRAPERWSRWGTLPGAVVDGPPPTR